MFTRLVIKVSLWLNDRSGVTGIDYGLMAGAVGLVVMAGSMAVGDGFYSMFGESGMGGFLSDRIGDAGGSAEF